MNILIVFLKELNLKFLNFFFQRVQFDCANCGVLTMCSIKRKTIHFFLPLVILLLFLSSCSKKNDFQRELNAHEKIEIDPFEYRKVSHSELFSDITYIPIPTNDDFLIGSIDKIIHKDNLIFILDRTITHSVFYFDIETGESIKIDKRGSGPGEYLIIRDIVYDSEKQELIVYCKMRNKVIHYSLLGEFIKEESLPFHTERIGFFKNGYTLFTEYTINPKLNQSGYLPSILLFQDNEIKEQAEFFKKDINRLTVWTSHPDFSQIDKEKYSIKPDHCNYIYHITPDSIYPAYFLDFGQYNIDSRYWREAEKKDVEPKSIDDFCNRLKLCEIYPVFEDSNYIYFSYIQNQRRYGVFYSKQTKEVIQTHFVFNDTDQITPFYPILLQDGKIYCLLNAEDIVASNEFLAQRQTLPESILKNTNEFDNPVIVAFTLKSF